MNEKPMNESLINDFLKNTQEIPKQGEEDKFIAIAELFSLQMNMIQRLQDRILKLEGEVNQLKAKLNLL